MTLIIILPVLAASFKIHLIAFVFFLLCDPIHRQIQSQGFSLYSTETLFTFTTDTPHKLSFFQRFQQALRLQHPSPTSSTSHINWAGTAVPGLPPSTLTWRWEEKTFPWASEQARVPLYCSMSTLFIENTWPCSSTIMVTRIKRIYVFLWLFLQQFSCIYLSPAALFSHSISSSLFVSSSAAFFFVQPH